MGTQTERNLYAHAAYYWATVELGSQPKPVVLRELIKQFRRYEKTAKSPESGCAPHLLDRPRAAIVGLHAAIVSRWGVPAVATAIVRASLSLPKGAP